MTTLQLTPAEARRLKSKLMNAPVAPTGLAHLINVGTDEMLDVLERQYFETELPDGLSCFKYLEGDYGSGKTQFIQCIAERARRHRIVTSLVTIDEQCPFSSPLAILRSVASAFVAEDETGEGLAKGIEVLLQSWIRKELRGMGIARGDAVPEQVKRQVQRPFVESWLGAPDAQMVAGLQALGRRVLALECGAASSPSDQELVDWVRGGRVISANLRAQGMYEAASDSNGFARLKTVIQFVRGSLGYKGVFVAFDEGTRTSSFRRGSVKQRQAVENMLSLINQNTEGEFGGTMFMYAALPEFRTAVISTYRALSDRLGSVAFIPGQPMTPLIKLDQVYTDEMLHLLGERLMDVFSLASGHQWDRDRQRANRTVLLSTQKRILGFPTAVPPRHFVYHWCHLLESQLSGGEVLLEKGTAAEFVDKYAMPEAEEVV